MGWRSRLSLECAVLKLPPMRMLSTDAAAHGHHHGSWFMVGLSCHLAFG